MSSGSRGNRDAEDTGGCEGEGQQSGTGGLTGAAWAVQKALGHQPVLPWQVAFPALQDVMAILTIHNVESHLLQKYQTPGYFTFLHLPCWHQRQRVLHLGHTWQSVCTFLPFRRLLPQPGVLLAVLSSDAQRWCMHCTPTAGGEEGTQIRSRHRSSSLGQLYHFPEVHTGLLALLGRTQSVRCDK